MTFANFRFNNVTVLVGEPSGQLAPGGSSWFSLPGNIAATDITAVTPEPGSLVLIGWGLGALCFLRRRRYREARQFSVVLQ